MGRVSVVGKTGEQNDGQQIRRKKEKKRKYKNAQYVAMDVGEF